MVSVKRKSMADAGMQTVATDVRRSGRQLVRPLEYWHNEKVVYSRKYAELPKVHHVVHSGPRVAQAAGQAPQAVGPQHAAPLVRGVSEANLLSRVPAHQKRTRLALVQFHMI